MEEKKKKIISSVMYCFWMSLEEIFLAKKVLKHLKKWYFTKHTIVKMTKSWNGDVLS